MSQGLNHHPDRVTQQSDAAPELQAGMSAIFKVLADPTRLKIILSLFSTPLCVHDVVQATKLEQSSVSHHLRRLRQANLVTCQRVGKNIFYHLADSHVLALLAVARDHAHESL